MLSAQDILGRRIDQLGTLANFDLNAAGILFFQQIFVCSDRQFPANDLKKVVVCFVGISNVTAAQIGTCAIAFGIPGSNADWNTVVLPAGGLPYPGFMRSVSTPGLGLGSSGYAPATIFGATPLVNGPGTCTITAYGWGE